jgi:hypothetical protein
LTAPVARVSFPVGRRGGSGIVDDAFARQLVGDACDAPGDATEALRPLLAPVAYCSRRRPWGIHADLTGGSCPRCGWAPSRRRARASST